jgi:hypothetical protein
MIQAIVRERGFQPPWYTVIVYACECGQVRVRKSWQGPTPTGAFYCPTKAHLIGFDGKVTLVSR